ncbi:MAG TPA: PQQ-dependent sugar dehydrogenase [Hyphomonadaceae bacterium]|nr:PQQ-dependent sugar dehydrogenase [Hyphomonadaceae bacterium]
MKRLLLTTIATLCLATPVVAQQAPPKPTDDQLAAVYKEDQLNDPKCGVPRNAGDDYRPTPATPDQTRAPRVNDKQKFKIETVASGLKNPWSITFLPDNNMLVTIRNSGLKIVKPDGTVSDLLPGTPTIKNSIPLFGMHDVVLDKDFKKNRTFYVVYNTTPEGAKGSVGYIASAKLPADEKSVTDWKVLKEGAMTPRRLIQAKDGTLLVITADIITPYVSAQNLASPQGKIIRINTDGSIPKNNPFVNNKDAEPSVYAVGFRDAQGITFRPGTSELWIVENEPRGGDELNKVEAGKNYGFPTISYGRDNNGKMLGEGITAKDGLEQPVYFWTPSIATSGLVFYDGDKLKGWKGSAFLGGLSGMQLVRLEINKQGRVTGEEKLLRDQCKRIRDVRQGPDGLLYVLTDETNGEILKLSPG